MKRITASNVDGRNVYYVSDVEKVPESVAVVKKRKEGSYRQTALFTLKPGMVERWLRE